MTAVTARRVKMRPLSRITGRGDVLDSVKQRKEALGSKYNVQLLERAYTAWNNLRSAREERERCMRYCYGDQWGDLIEYNGKTMTERQYILSQNKVPLTNNLTRRLVSAVKGAWLKQGREPICVARDPEKSMGAEMLSMALQCNWQQSGNNLQQMLSVSVEDYAIGGLLIARESWELTEYGYDAATYIYNPNYIFFNSTMRDPMMRDMDMIGVIHDVTRQELIGRFPIEPDKVRELLETNRDYYFRSKSLPEYDIDKQNDLHYVDFWCQNNDSLYRIYEIWTRETKQRYLCIDRAEGDMFRVDVDNIRRVPLERYGLTVERENERRLAEGLLYGIPPEQVPLIDYGQLPWSNRHAGLITDTYWFYQYLLPNGEILYEGESPFACGCPFTLAVYPMVNGEVHSFVSDVVPQQKNINRLTTLNDVIIRSTAKGALLIDRQSIPEDSSQEIIREQWSDPDGLVVYDGRRGGQRPIQLNNTSTNVGIDQALATQLKFMEDVSGVHGAIQGKEAHAGQSAALYSQQANNATTTLLPFFESFKHFVRGIAIKKAKMIQQYYTEKRFVNISGTYAGGVRVYDPQLVAGLEMDVSIQETASTDVQRAVNNEILIELWRNGAINAMALLEVGKFPFSERLLQYMREQEQQMQAQQSAGQAVAAQPMPQELQQQVEQQLGDHRSIGGMVMDRLNKAQAIASVQ